MGDQTKKAVMNRTLLIRPFTVADQPPTRALILAGLADHFGVLDETMNPDLDDIAANYLRPGSTFVVADLATEIVGCGALVTDAPGTGRLVRMSVSRTHRGH